MIIFLALFILLLCLFVCIFLQISLKDQRKKLGIISGQRIYQDTELNPGEVLTSKTLPLVGKPDYIYKDKNSFIPVEVKTTSTPKTPYKSHIAQLIAYCYLIEENYRVTPEYGIIQYPNEKFTVGYTQVQRQRLKTIVTEILNYKTGADKLDFKNISIELCKNCQKEIS